MPSDASPNALRDRLRASTDDVFPPQTLREAEIEALVEFLRGVIPEPAAVYVSAPITTGRRFVEWHAARHDLSPSAENYQRYRLDEVVTPNRKAAVELAKRVRQSQSGPVIDPTVVGDIEGWTQGDYRSAWARVIEAFARRVVFANGWEFSSGCSYEFLVAIKAGIETVDESDAPISPLGGIALIRCALNEMSLRGLSSEFLKAIVEEIEALPGLPQSALENQPAAESSTFKDAVLDSLSNHGNVAQFVSFSPGLEVRYSRVVGQPPNAKFRNAREAIGLLLEASAERSVNVRSYHPENPKSREFVYGLKAVDVAEATVRRLAGQGLYTIANETVDVNDGGVSGVALGNVVEFAPGDTPRCVEKPGTLSLSRAVALAVLRRVYGFSPTFPAGQWRVEFSVHPKPRGYRRGHTILWEAERSPGHQRAPLVHWPNRFSRFLGDKAFGLLLADCLGLPVPSTVVICRNVAPFSFGRSTGTGETWLRTCPREPVPGKFSTLWGWTDPFKLLTQEDPRGEELMSVLSQEGVRAAFSGATIDRGGGDVVVEGVEGRGSDFMLGKVPADDLPPATVEAVKKLVHGASELVGGAVKLEWAQDEEVAWILQLHQVGDQAGGAVVVPGEPARFRRFTVGDGIDRFRNFVADAKAAGEGITLVGSVGVTSHFGDILRRSGVPSRIESGQ